MAHYDICLNADYQSIEMRGSFSPHGVPYTLDRYTLYPHQYFCLFLGLSHQKDPGLHFLCIFLIIG